MEVLIHVVPTSLYVLKPRSFRYLAGYFIFKYLFSFFEAVDHVMQPHNTLIKMIALLVFCLIFSVPESRLDGKFLTCSV